MNNPECKKCIYKVGALRNSDRCCCVHPMTTLYILAPSISGVSLKQPSKTFPFEYVDGIVSECKFFTIEGGAPQYNIPQQA